MGLGGGRGGAAGGAVPEPRTEMEMGQWPGTIQVLSSQAAKTAKFLIIDCLV